MSRWLVLFALAIGGLLASTDRASAWWPYGSPYGSPYYSQAAFPMINPPGYYRNLYYYQWYHPWYAYYNYSHGPYANWHLGGGYASYAGQGMNQPYFPYPGYVGGPHYSAPPFDPTMLPGSSHAPR